MHSEPALITLPIAVSLVEGEIVLSCCEMPCLTPGAARETAARLIAAADLADLKVRHQ